MQQIVCDVCGTVKKGRAPNWSVVAAGQDNRRKDYCPDHAAEAAAERVWLSAVIRDFTIEVSLGEVFSDNSVATMGARLTQLSHVLRTRGIDDKRDTYFIYDQWESGRIGLCVKRTCSYTERDELEQLIEDTLAGREPAATERG